MPGTAALRKYRAMQNGQGGKHLEMQEIPDKAFHPHDHSRCRRAVLAAAERSARDHGLRLTPLRRRVLEILLESHRAMGAYEVLERLAREGWGDQPPTAYRALAFLARHGLVHKVRRLNAYVACTRSSHSDPALLLICRECGRVGEAEGGDVLRVIGAVAQARGFAVERLGVEALGLCPACAGEGA